MYIFLDESGNFIGDKDKYFVIGGFITNNPRRTAKAFRKWQHTKFPKKLRRKNEVKFSDTGLDEKLRLKTLDYFTKLKNSIIASKELFEDYWKDFPPNKKPPLG